MLTIILNIIFLPLAFGSGDMNVEQRPVTSQEAWQVPRCSDDMGINTPGMDGDMLTMCNPYIFGVYQETTPSSYFMDGETVLFEDGSWTSIISTSAPSMATDGTVTTRRWYQTVSGCAYPELGCTP